MSEGNEKSRPLYICSDVNKNTDYCWTSASIPINTWTLIQIRQTTLSCDTTGYCYQILIDGEVKYNVINHNPRVFHDVKVYASNPWNLAQRGEIKDLEYPEGLYYDTFHMFTFCMIYQNLS